MARDVKTIDTDEQLVPRAVEWPRRLESANDDVAGPTK
jgi:hypothetical protein